MPPRAEIRTLLLVLEM